MNSRRRNWFRGKKNQSTFDPTSIGSCEIWFDASDDSSIVRNGVSNNLDLVERFLDKSGNFRNIEQPLEANRPSVSDLLLGGKQLIDSVSIGRFLWSQSDFTLDGYPITFFMVARQQPGVYCSYAIPTVNNRRVLFNNQSTTSGNFQVRSGGAGTQGLTPNSSLVFNDFYIYEGIAESNVLRKFAANGGDYLENTENVPYTSSTRFFLFRSSNQNPIGVNSGLFAEVIMYSKVPNAFEREQILNYLSNKWGIPLEP